MSCCHNCGIDAPTKQMTFYQNIGVLVIRFSKRVKGKLCKRCIHKTFWSFTTTTLFLGWWSAVSLFLAPCFLLNNIFRYVFALGLEAPPPDAISVQLSDVEAVRKIAPFSDELVEMLNSKKKSIDEASEFIAQKAGVAPRHVILYLQALVEVSKKEG